MFYPFKEELPIEEFKTAFRNYLSFLKLTDSDFDGVEKVETLSLGKATSMYVPGLRKNPKGREIMDKVNSVQEGYLGSRCTIPKGPAEYRDVVIPDIDTRIKVAYIENVFKIIARKDQWIVSACPGEEKISRIKKVLLCENFFHLDLKKEGLTFPRQLAVAAGEVLQEMYNVNASLISDFRDLFVTIDGATYRTERGRTLGWANQMCSVILSCLLQTKAFDLRGQWFNLIGLVYTDDLVLGSKGRFANKIPTVQGVEVLAVFNDYLTRFGFIVGKRKCYPSKSLTFLGTTYSKESHETFYNEWGLPLALQPHPKTNSSTADYRLLAKAWHARTHFEAKTITNLFWIKRHEEDYDKELIYQIATIWGPEFEDHSIDEIDLPYAAGGWITPYDENLDASLDKETWRRYTAAFLDVRMPHIHRTTDSGQKFDQTKYRSQREKDITSSTINRVIDDDMAEDVAEADPQFWFSLAFRERLKFKHIPKGLKPLDIEFHLRGNLISLKEEPPDS